MKDVLSPITELWGEQDIDKAIHYLEMVKERDYK